MNTPRSLRAGLLAALSLVAHAPAQLVVQSPSPSGRNLGGAAFNSPTHGFIVGENHHLLETFDGGQTWTQRMGTGFSTDPFYTITFAGPSRVYLAGNNQDAYRSTDGGATWSQMTGFPFGSARVLDFITPTTGFVGLNGALCYTPDGGITWPLRSGYPDCPIMFGMDFRDENLGLASGIRSTPYNDGGIYRTTDGGVTWTLVHIAGSNDLLWLDDQTATALSGADILRSDDAGLSWYVYSSGVISTGASDFARAGASNTLCAVSGVGDIWYSSDLGFSWFQVVQGIGVLPANWSVSFSDELHGWVVGANGLAYRTTNGGSTWELVNSGCGDEVTDIDFAEGDTFGVAVTNRGFVFRTRDRGGHWDVRRLRETGIIFGREEGFRAVEVIDENTILAGGAGGIFFRSDDGGESWFSLGYPFGLPDFEIRDIEFTDALNGWIVGFYDDVAVYRTTNGGFSWDPVPDIGGSMVAVKQQGERIWIATAGNRVYRTINDGGSWSFVDLPGDGYGISDIEFADGLNGWAVGWFGTMARTTNGGVSWTTVARPQNETYLDVSMNGTSEIWAVGYDNSAFRYFYMKSTNGGTTWTRTSLAQYEEWFTRINVRPSGRFWLAGSAGKIVYSPASSITISLPADLPPQVAPDTPTPVPVRIVAGEESVEPGSEIMWVQRTPGGPFEAVPMQNIASGEYTAVIPALACGDTPRLYFSARGSNGALVTLPANAPAATLSTRVGVIEDAALLTADFESGLPQGWTTSGLWHITAGCAPTGSCGAGSRAYFGIDGQCNYNNGQRVQGVLRSPQVTLPTLQPGQNISISFCSALDNEYPNNAVGDNDQAQLWFVYTGGSAPIQWFTDHAAARTQTFTINQHAGRTGRFEWRFDSMNTFQNSFRGWHVDAVVLTAPALVCDSPCVADFNSDNIVSSQDFFDFLTAFFAGNADVNRDGATSSQDFFDFITAFFAGCD